MNPAVSPQPSSFHRSSGKGSVAMTWLMSGNTRLPKNPSRPEYPFVAITSVFARTTPWSVVIVCCLPTSMCRTGVCSAIVTSRFTSTSRSPCSRSRPWSCPAVGSRHAPTAPVAWQIAASSAPFNHRRGRPHFASFSVFSWAASARPCSV